MIGLAYCVEGGILPEDEEFAYNRVSTDRSSGERSVLHERMARGVSRL